MYGDPDEPLAGARQPRTVMRGGDKFSIDENGRWGRVYRPKDVLRQGGLRQRPGQDMSFETDLGEPLPDFQALADEINLGDDASLAWIDRAGDLRLRRGQTARLTEPLSGNIRGARITPSSLAQGMQTGSTTLTDFGLAKQNARAQSMASREHAYRQALEMGDDIRSNRLAESMLRNGAPISDVHGIAQSVKSQNDALLSSRQNDPGISRWIHKQFMDNANNREGLHALALQAEALGLGDVAPIIRGWAQQLGMDERAAAGRAERADRFAQTEGRAERDFQYRTQRDEIGDQFRMADDQRADRAAELREAEAVRSDSRAMAEEVRRDSREARAQRGEVRSEEAHVQRMDAGTGKEMAQSIGRTLASLRAEAGRTSLMGKGSAQQSLENLALTYPELADGIRARFMAGVGAGADEYAALENALLGAYRGWLGSQKGGRRAPAREEAPEESPDGQNWQDYEGG